MTQLVHKMANTDKEYPCVQCGSRSANVIREAPNEADRRLKCNNCNFTYSAEDSLAADEAGQVPEQVAERLDPTVDSPVSNPRTAKRESKPEPEVKQPSSVEAPSKEIPRNPAFVIVSKNRELYEFCTKRDFKKNLLKWIAADEPCDVFELQAKKVSANIDVV